MTINWIILATADVMLQTCNNCDKEFNRTPGHMPKGKHIFCSLKCRTEYFSARNGNIKITNSEGKLLHTFRFQSKRELRWLLTRFRRLRGGYVSVIFD